MAPAFGWGAPTGTGSTAAATGRDTALHTVALCRWAKDPRTREYVQRRRGQGLDTAEILR